MGFDVRLSIKTTLHAFLCRCVCGICNDLKTQLGPGKKYRFLVFIDNGIGDVLMLASALASLKHSSGGDIYLAVYGDVPASEMFKGTNVVSRSFEVSRKSTFVEKLRWVRSIVRNNYDVLINSGPSQSMWLVVMAACGRMESRVCIQDVGWMNPYVSMFNRQVPAGVNEVDRGFRLIEAAIGERLSKRIDFRFSLSSDESRRAQETIDAVFGVPVVGAGNLVVIQPGSSEHQQWKRWPAKCYNELIKTLVAREDMYVIVLGTEKEKRLGDSVLDRVGSRARGLFGRTTIRETVALISWSTLVICNDSSFMHFSSVLQVPAVVIFGPTDPSRTVPQNANISIIRSGISCSPCFSSVTPKGPEECKLDYACLGGIRVHDVHDKVKIILDNIQA